MPADEAMPLWVACQDRARISHLIDTCFPPTSFTRRYFHHMRTIIRKYQLKVILVWQKKEYGSTRSIVRKLGTILSLQPCPRPQLQLVQDVHPLDYDEKSTTPTLVVPSLGDILWVANDEGQASTRFRAESWGKKKSAVHRNVPPTTTSMPTVPKNRGQDNFVNEEAIKKISALEDELTLLRAQIAAIVGAQGSRHGHFAIPSPPLPPPPPHSGFDVSNSAIELIKQRCAARKTTSTIIDDIEHQRNKCVPSMMDVLKDLNKVQLRTVERSPGGTPLPRTKKRRSLPLDPVSLLTRALKQKFAHQTYDDDSSDKENRSFDASPFSSPEAPMVGRHVLKPNIKNNLIGAKELKQDDCTYKKGEENLKKAYLVRGKSSEDAGGLMCSPAARLETVWCSRPTYRYVSQYDPCE
ncbi:mitochondrial fission regulator 2 isoform B [Alligator mississippiensis]|uniref:Mitochondrial fission regulator n=1 Tax=Alligator mississippiensis TaxID=8496 RepID=A0A151M3I5_ALLMI|nr:mitochondrial fission regulator 2 isoform B [Alligator mississippiensis]